MKKINKIAHLTSVHARYDVRIFIKQCKSLARQDNFSVSLIVADNLGDEIVDTIKIYDVGKLKGRLNRFLRTSRNMYQKAIALDCDIYHLHDPELIPMGLKLKKKGKKVIFDAHEDFPRQLMNKYYLPIFIRKSLAMVLEKYENYAAGKFDKIITATPFIRDRFIKKGTAAVAINNFPLAEEFDLDNEAIWAHKKNQICYIGGITKTRGIIELIKAINEIDSTLVIAGKYQPKELKKELVQLKAWDASKIEDKGFVDRKEIIAILKNAKIGIVTLHPVTNYLDSLPVKMFEYMACGIPFIASDFPYWKELIEEYNCGIFVNPLKYEEIAKGIKRLLDDPKTSEKMGNRGKKIIREKFNWHIEEKKLLASYKTLLSPNFYDSTKQC